MRVSVMGTGYVGLVTGAALAEHSHEVVCLDVIPEKIEMLNRKESPIFEPGLEELLQRHVSEGRLKGSLEIEREIAASEVTYICVGTPSDKDGSIDLKYIEAASESVGKALAKKPRETFHTVVVKSTVVPLTTEQVVGPAVAKHSGRKAGEGFGLVMNPEFLKEGAAVQDAMHPDRIVIGATDARSRQVMGELYGKFDCPVLHTDPRTAEFIKYGSNAFLAVKISFANEMANAAEAWGVDWKVVAEGMGLDQRISGQFLAPGVGFGGSCFPKDVRALQAKAAADGHASLVLSAALEVNDIQPKRALELAQEMAGDLKGKKVALLGLAFKPDTDDVRETRAQPIAEALLKAGASVTAHDVEGQENFKAMAPQLKMDYMDTPSDALQGAHVAIVQVPWQAYRELPVEVWRALMEQPQAVIDCRRGLDGASFERAGLPYRAIGLGRP